MARGPRNLRVAADGVGLTQFGGVALIEQFFQRIHLQGALWRHVRFAQRNNRYSISESLKALLYPLVLGLGRIETTEPLRYNGVFHYLAGLPGYPEATSLRRFLGRFARSGRSAFVQLHDRWRTTMLEQPARALFDLDSTVLTVYGRQERAEVGYNPKKRGRRSYLPLLCFEGNTQDCWEGSYHPGDTHFSTSTIPLLERAFAKLPELIGEVRVRADGAFFDHKIIEFIEGKRAFYVIVARLSRPLKNRLPGLLYRRVSPGVWTSEFWYCPQGWPGPRRFVVIRRSVPEEPSAQLHLFQMGGYSYQLLVTNLKLTPVASVALLQPASPSGIDHSRTERRLRPGQDPDKGFLGQRGLLPDRLAGLQPAELVQATLCSSSSATGHAAAPPAAAALRARPIRAAWWSPNPAPRTELRFYRRFFGYSAAHPANTAPLPRHTAAGPDNHTLTKSNVNTRPRPFFTQHSG